MNNRLEEELAREREASIARAKGIQRKFRESAERVEQMLDMLGFDHPIPEGLMPIALDVVEGTILLNRLEKEYGGKK